MKWPSHLKTSILFQNKLEESSILSHELQIAYQNHILYTQEPPDLRLTAFQC